MPEMAIVTVPLKKRDVALETAAYVRSPPRILQDGARRCIDFHENENFGDVGEIR